MNATSNSGTPAIWKIAAAFALAVAAGLARGLRWPSQWATGHWIISWRFGLVKRGLPGELVQALTNPTQSTINMVGTGITILWGATLVWIGVQIARKPAQLAGWTTGAGEEGRGLPLRGVCPFCSFACL